MIAPHVKSLRSQARNFSNFASILCLRCQKKEPFIQISSNSACGFSELATTLPSSRLTSSPERTHFGTQNIRHISNQKHPDQNESKVPKENESDSSDNEDSCSEKNENEDKMEGMNSEEKEELNLETLTKNQETAECISSAPSKAPPPDPPTDCCMSGCANCVWIKYAEEMRDYYCEEGIEKALKDIEKIEDTNLKAYLKLELSFILK